MTSTFHVCVVIEIDFWLTPSGFNITPDRKGENHSCSLTVKGARCAEVNLAGRGSPAGWQMGAEEPVLDSLGSGFAVTPAAGERAGGRKHPPRGCHWEGAQEVALGCGSARRAALNTCPFCCACVLQAQQRLSPWQSARVVYCSTVVPSDGEYRHGEPGALRARRPKPDPLSARGAAGCERTRLGTEEVTDDEASQGELRKWSSFLISVLSKRDRLCK